jgi:PBP1b-binding outer membrane lipoprotein LpoB
MKQETKQSVLVAALLALALAGCQKQEEVPAPQATPEMAPEAPAPEASEPMMPETPAPEMAPSDSMPTEEPAPGTTPETTPPAQ